MNERKGKNNWCIEIRFSLKLVVWSIQIDI